MNNDQKILAAIEAHTNWFIRLRKAIESGTIEFKPN